ncbi:MAG: hypothetical protein WC789_10685 [Lentisphaeria bacterium]
MHGLFGKMGAIANFVRNGRGLGPQRLQGWPQLSKGDGDEYARIVDGVFAQLAIHPSERNLKRIAGYIMVNFTAFATVVEKEIAYLNARQDLAEPVNGEKGGRPTKDVADKRKALTDAVERYRRIRDADPDHKAGFGTQFDLLLAAHEEAVLQRDAARRAEEAAARKAAKGADAEEAKAAPAA